MTTIAPLVTMEPPIRTYGQDRPEQAERSFRAFLGDWYVRQGVSPSDPLHAHYVDAEADATYLEGTRIARELLSETRTSVRGRRVLDLGAGFCGAFAALTHEGAFVVGADISRTHLDAGRVRLEFHGISPRLVEASAFTLPFDGESFDCVICTSVLEHIDAAERNLLLSEAARVLKPDGVMYLAFPNLFGVQNVLRDPHYQLFGVTLMPRRLANAYTQWRLRRSYGAEVFPVASVVARQGARYGVTLFNLARSERAILERIERPALCSRRPARFAVSVVQRLGLAPLARALVRAWAATGSSAVLIGHKDRGRA